MRTWNTQQAPGAEEWWAGLVVKSVLTELFSRPRTHTHTSHVWTEIVCREEIFLRIILNYFSLSGPQRWLAVALPTKWKVFILSGSVWSGEWWEKQMSEKFKNLFKRKFKCFSLFHATLDCFIEYQSYWGIEGNHKTLFTARDGNDCLWKCWSNYSV